MRQKTGIQMIENQTESTTTTQDAVAPCLRNATSEVHWYEWYVSDSGIAATPQWHARREKHTHRLETRRRQRSVSHPKTADVVVYRR